MQLGCTPLSWGAAQYFNNTFIFYTHLIFQTEIYLLCLLGTYNVAQGDIKCYSEVGKLYDWPGNFFWFFTCESFFSLLMRAQSKEILTSSHVVRGSFSPSNMFMFAHAMGNGSSLHHTSNARWGIRKQSISVIHKSTKDISWWVNKIIMKYIKYCIKCLTRFKLYNCILTPQLVHIKDKLTQYIYKVKLIDFVRLM